MLRSVARRGRGTFLAAAIVVANFVVALQLTGLSYSRFEWAAYAGVYENGAECMAGADCNSTICDDGVCCDRACPAPARCNFSGRLGVCTDPIAPAPALDHRWLGGALLLLFSIGLFGLRRRRHS